MHQMKHTSWRRAQKGSALILAMVTTMLLFIIGITFLVNVRQEQDSVSNVTDSAGLDNAVDAVVNEISLVLAEDIYGADDLPLNDDGSDEAYDYPGGDDLWLASLEPRWFYDSSLNPHRSFIIWP